MAEDRKGSSEHAAQHQHGVQARPEPAAPQTVEQRVAKLEGYVKTLQDAVNELTGVINELTARKKARAAD